MNLKLHLHNPSHYPRGGYVVTPWQQIQKETGLDAGSVAVFDADGVQLDTQVHEVDPGDSSREVLVFWLDKPIRPDDADLFGVSTTVEVGQRRQPMSVQPLKCELVPPGGGECHRVNLSNGRLDVWFELAASPSGDESSSFYAGSATSVLLKQGEGEPPILTEEMLDSFNYFFLDHDPEKRCMQVDLVRLSLPAWASDSEAVFSPIRQPYQLLSHSEGPVRASVAVASSPFDYHYHDPRAGEDRKLSCRLHRTVSLYRGSDFVIDELSVRGTLSGADTPRSVDLYFTARYFMFMDLGRDGNPKRHQRIWDWFGVCSDYAPNPAFSFATDAHCGPVAQGPPDYPFREKQDRAFSWELERAGTATCLHLFSRCTAKAIEDRAGAAWYEYIYRPLWAEIAR